MASSSDPAIAQASTKRHVARTGITVLACPDKEEDCVVDVVFVHGLQGHPERTWSTQSRQSDADEDQVSENVRSSRLRLRKLFSRKDKSAEQHPDKVNPVFWPQDLLPEDCAAARIMTFGYDSDISKFFDGAVNKNSFYDHANDLLRALLRQRQGPASQRPIIFVAHSLGGIIVKQALVDSERAERRIIEKSIHRYTEFIVFLGTPHRGSPYAGWGEIAERIARAAFFDTNRHHLSHLQVHGLELANLERDFANLLDKRTFSVFNFQEALGFKGVKGLNGKIVENWSSQIGDHRMEPSESINANHMSMCRYYGRHDPGYKQVGGEIQSKVNELVKQHQQELSQEHADFLQHLIGGISEESYSGTDIKDPHDDTCQWLMQRKSFCDWLDMKKGIFWMKGNPGAGKSVLMKYLLVDPDRLLWDRIRDSNCTIKVGFFFRSTRTISERCTNGMLRTLLFQIFQREMRIYQKALRVLRELRQGRRTAEHIKWTDRQLHDVFKNIFQGLHEDDKPTRLLFFLDALDECLEPEMESTLETLHKLLSTARDHDISLGICISSRPLPGLDREVRAASGWISLQKENHEAIYTYIRTELASKHDVRRGENYHRKFAERVAERADGVFLWVALVVPRLRKKIDNGGTLRELEALLQDIPNDLRDLFVDILKRIAGSELGITMRMLQIATLVQRRLTLEEFQHALAFHPNSPYKSLKDWQRSSDYLESGQMIIARLQHYSGGLLEARVESEIEQDAATQYKTFLEKSSLHAPSHETLGRRHANHLAFEDERSGLLPRNSPVQEPHEANSQKHNFEPISRRGTFPKSYNSETWNIPINLSDARRSHAAPTACAPQPNRRLRVVRFIHETAKYFFSEHEGFQILYSLIEDSSQAKSGQISFCSPAGCYLTGGHEFIVNSCASYLNLRELRQSLVQALTISSIPRLDDFYFSQYISESWFHHLRAAEEGGIAQTHILEWLISIKPSCLTRCICWAGEHNITSWVRWCIENEVDVNDIDATRVSYGRPIQVAVGNGFHELAELLIKAGANVNGTTGGPGTTLRLAERKGDERMAKILRGYGGVLSQPYWIPPKGQFVSL
ncbi:Nn.00g075950.m01.CDS01 [Neocucurbitaria sp. VM-36]